MLARSPKSATHRLPAPIRVLHLIKFFRPTFTGHGIFLERITPVLDALAPHVEHDLLVTDTARPESCPPVASTLRRIDYLQKRKTAEWYRETLLLWWLLRHMYRYRIVHVHTHVDRYFLSYILAKLLGKRLVLTATLDDSVPMLTQSYRPTFKRLVSRLFRIFDAFISISPKLHVETETVVAAGKAHMVPIGIPLPSDPRKDRCTVRASYGLADNDIVLIFVGGICARKDPLFLVEQMRSVVDFCDRARLLIVGPILEVDHYERMLAEIKKLRLERHVIFTGDVHNPYPLFAMADIMTFASHLEGFGTVVTEAMAHGLPVVVRHLPGVNDLFVRHGETGFLFSSADDYIGILQRLIDEPMLRERVGTAARALVCREFDNLRNAWRWLQIYGAVAGHKASSLPSSPASDAAATIPASTSVVDTRFHTPAPLKAGHKPILITTVDAEELFDWSKPFTRDVHDVTSMAQQHLAHRIFERYGVVPTYLVTYPVISQHDGYKPLIEFARSRMCDIGAQLHPWVTPPFEEALNARNSFPNNLPFDLEYRKLRILTEAIAERVGERPRVYRAGRYGVGRRTGDLLKELGYLVDSSVMPQFGFPREGGPNFFGFSAEPYWVDAQHELMELPVSAGIVGPLARSVEPFAASLFADTRRLSLARAVLARTKLAERVKLTPEGIDIDAAKRLVRGMLADGTRVFTLSYHSPSLVPGSTPYVRSIADRDRLLEWLDGFYEFFFGEIGGTSVTALQAYNLMSQTSCAANGGATVPLQGERSKGAASVRSAA